MKVAAPFVHFTTIVSALQSDGRTGIVLLQEILDAYPALCEARGFAPLPARQVSVVLRKHLRRHRPNVFGRKVVAYEIPASLPVSTTRVA